MPEISRFFGIVIRMFFDDHNTPHFHAEFQAHRAIIEYTKCKAAGRDSSSKTVEAGSGMGFAASARCRKKKSQPTDIPRPFLHFF